MKFASKKCETHFHQFYSVKR